MFSQTAQEWFNGAWKRSKDSHKSMKDKEDIRSCVYREKNGPGCFVGCQVPSDVRLIEGKRASAQIDNGVISVSDLSTAKYYPADFLNELQNIHDNNPVESWEKLLREFTIKHRLTIPE